MGTVTTAGGTRAPCVKDAVGVAVPDDVGLAVDDDEMVVDGLAPKESVAVGLDERVAVTVPVGELVPERDGDRVDVWAEFDVS